MIDTTADLEALVERARQRPSVALDTEFVWERTYYPHLGVIQVGLSSEECFLVDAAACEDLSPLGALLADAGVIKILHDAQQDLTILCRVSGTAGRNVFDTRIVAGFAGLKSTISLQGLLNEVVGVELAKAETRTNWLVRPLSPEQVDYAIDDVRYLQEVRQNLLTLAAARGHTAWLTEELELLDNPALYEAPDPRAYFQRIKTSRPLAPRELAVLRELGAWRETEAQRRDRPRSHVVDDKALVSLARCKPTTLKGLQSINHLSPRGVERYGEVLLEQVGRGLAVSQEERPPPVLFPTDKQILDERTAVVWSHIEQLGEEKGIDPALVASRSEVKELICSGVDDHGARLARGWRRAFIGEDFLDQLTQWPAMRLSSSRRRRRSR